VQSESGFILPEPIKEHYCQDTTKILRRSSKSAAPMAVLLATWFALDMRMTFLFVVQ